MNSLPLAASLEKVVAKSVLPMLAPMVMLFILPFPGTVALRLICLGIAFFTALYSWRRLQVPSFPCKTAIVFWTCVTCGSLAYAIDFKYSLGEVKNEVGFPLIAFVSLFALSSDKARLRLACMAVTTGFVLIAAAAVFTYLWDGDWLAKPWYGGGPSTTHYLLMAWPIAGLAAYLSAPDRWRTALVLVLALVILISLLTLQRAVWIALAVQGFVVLCWLWRRRLGALNARRLTLAALLMVGMCIAGYHETRLARVKLDPTPQNIQSEVRLPVWREIITRVIDNPLKGAGVGQLVMNKAYPELVPPDQPLMWHAHNVVLNYALYAGVPGMLAIVGIFAAFGWRFWQLAKSSDNTVRAVGIAGVLIVSGVFARDMFNDFFVRDGAILFWALSGALFGYALRQQSVVSPARLDQ